MGLERTPDRGERVRVAHEAPTTVGNCLRTMRWNSRCMRSTIVRPICRRRWRCRFTGFVARWGALGRVCKLVRELLRTYQMLVLGSFWAVTGPDPGRFLDRMGRQRYLQTRPRRRRCGKPRAPVAREDRFAVRFQNPTHRCSRSCTRHSRGTRGSRGPRPRRFLRTRSYRRWLNTSPETGRA